MNREQNQVPVGKSPFEAVAAWLCGLVLLGLTLTVVVREAEQWIAAVGKIELGIRAPVDESVGRTTGAIFLNPDSYFWLKFARQIGEDGPLRIRHTTADNVPEGRDVHWSQSISWMLAGFGRLWQGLTGLDWPSALEAAAVRLNPAIEIVFLLCVFGLLAARFGPVASGLAVFTLASLYDLAWEFHSLRPDHQSLHVLFGTLAILGPALGGVGFVRRDKDGWGERDRKVPPSPFDPPSRSAAGWLFATGAVSLGLLTWVSAVVSIVIVGLTSMAALAVFFIPGADGGGKPDPGLWRLWGWTAAAVSLLLYLVEYSPSNFSLRLEVNGPLYSMAILFSGEALAHAARARFPPPGSRRVAAAALATVFAAGALVVPVLLVAGPTNWHALRDPLMLRLHAGIQEFQCLSAFANGNPGAVLATNFGFFPWLALAGIVLVISGYLDPDEVRATFFSLVIAGGLAVLSFLQVRWLGLFAPAIVWLAIVVLIDHWRLVAPWLIHPVARVGAVAVVIIAVATHDGSLAAHRRRELDAAAQGKILPDIIAEAVVNKRIALALREAAGPNARVMADPDIVPALAYFADASSVVSLYWENSPGLHAATAFFADHTGQEALRIADERGIEFVVVRRGDPRLAGRFHFVQSGRVDPLAAAETIAARFAALELAPLPWIEPVPGLSLMGRQTYTYEGKTFRLPWNIYHIRKAG